MHWNAEGVSNKKTELENFLFENSIDICCIQETHLKPEKNFKIRGYQVTRNDRLERTKGGVMTLVRNNLNAVETKRTTEEAEYLEMKVITKTTPLQIGNYYCPDNKQLSLDSIDVPDKRFLIAGDFNSQSQSWGYHNLDKRGEDIETWQDENHLLLANDPTDQPTFYSRRWHTTTTPDLAFCTEDIHSQLTRTVSPQLGGSDHRPVVLTLCANISHSTQPPRWNYKKAKWNLFRIRTNELTNDIQLEGRDINNIVKDFNSSILKAAKETIPRGVRKNYAPYWTDKLQTAHEELTKAREDAEKEPSQANNIRLQEKKAVYLKTKIESTRKSWREKTSALNLEKESTKLWRLTKSLNDESWKEPNITLEENDKILTGRSAANAFAHSFAKVSDTKVPNNRKKEIRQEERDRTTTNNDPDAMTAELTKEELIKAIKQLKKKKSPGPDGITNEMIQHMGNTALQKLLDIYNQSWKQGQVPQCWKKATMIPILKKGKNKHHPSSYRPISLTSCVCKTMERIVNQRLQWYLESEGILAEEQAGFRRYRSTEDQTTHLSQIIEDSFQEQKVTLAAFVDLTKAFDKVWKDGLLVKLQRGGICGNMYRWTKSYLHNRRARVQVNGQQGQTVLLRQGVPQGGVLSPTLFILYINDLLAELPKGVQAALYADDLVLWATEEYATTATYRMQLALNHLTSWANDWCITINKEKTSATLFTLSTKQKPGQLRIGDTYLQFEDQQTYLGVTFDKRLTWKQHIENAEATARRKLSIMRKLAGTQWGANEKILKTVYQGAVRPHLEYGSSAWMTATKTHHQTLDKVQNQALRIITGGLKSTPIEKMEHITGIQPLSKRRACKAMTQAAKFRTMENHPMNHRQAQTRPKRLKRTNFSSEMRGLQRQHQNQLPSKLEMQNPTAEPPPWTTGHANVTIRTTVPNLGTKNEDNDLVKKTMTLAMLEDLYPQTAWTQVYTDGSASDAVRCGGAGVYIQSPDGQPKTSAAPTGTFCTNYRAEVEALILAAQMATNNLDKDAHVVFLTDALSVLEAVTNNKLPRLEEALKSIKCARIVLQWIPSHCGIHGNEKADILAKAGAEKEQEVNAVSLNEMKTIIKALHRSPRVQDSYHELTRKQQVIIFRLRTGHNRLNHHMCTRFRRTPSPLCSCGTAEQTTEHILQDCPGLQRLREQMWPQETTLRDKLYGTVEALQRTADFVMNSNLQV
jgi:ribonuclease HI/endonuclease/exonuclease/phosphatase family metal-dependent hydrolase